MSRGDRGFALFLMVMLVVMTTLFYELFPRHRGARPNGRGRLGTGRHSVAATRTENSRAQAGFLQPDGREALRTAAGARQRRRKSSAAAMTSGRWTCAPGPRQ